MLVFKFGGASVKDSNGVKNLTNIVRKYSDELVIVVSALGKTTNALEEILKLSYEDADKCRRKLENLKSYHNVIIKELFPDSEA
ncbi:MAG: aspartate kinase, partial [Marinilabiliales bacterium]